MRTRASMATARSSASPRAGTGSSKILGHLAADRERRVQRLAGVLVDHGDGVRAHAAQLGRVQRQDVAAVDRDPPAGDAAVGGR